MSLATISRSGRRAAPVKILQFGEGVFLRGFFEPLVQELNERGLFDGSIAVVPPRSGHALPPFRKQDGVYTLLTRGLKDGKQVDTSKVIEVITRTLDPVGEWDALLKLASEPGLRFVVSNTTEAGIVFSTTDKPTDAPPASFPGKLTAVLHARFTHFKGEGAKGVHVISCELIENNGNALREIVLKLAQQWGLEDAFEQWVKTHCFFANTLVDRIVPGYPKADADALWEKLGYRDELMVAAEPFNFFALQADASLAKELPLDKLPDSGVVFASDIAPLRERKVRILNGAHTMSVLGAFLAGHDIVREMVGDATFANFIQKGLAEEVIPTMNLPRPQLDAFAAATLERFGNPFIRHELLAISLNSTSKWKARILPTLKDFVATHATIPDRLAHSLAGLILFYKGKPTATPTELVGDRNAKPYPIKDSAPALETMARLWTAHASDLRGLTQAVLAETSLWGEDINRIAGLKDSVSKHLEVMVSQGVVASLKQLDGVE